MSHPQNTLPAICLCPLSQGSGGLTKDDGRGPHSALLHNQPFSSSPFPFLLSHCLAGGPASAHLPLHLSIFVSFL
ncbi:hypothetical protein Cadr_000011768 [Camelus dromedarius]|uniref:Uncharacterized protein n=1 Tax=Camelus dromedarius TaxID=9838 RepID=A0A5N4DRV4_CAMDR|nr:hypothetical protein Cadr_000011768 [Camelus dromedarius]